MYLLQVRLGKKWVTGINKYETIFEANKRIEELYKAGIISRLFYISK